VRSRSRSLRSVAEDHESSSSAGRPGATEERRAAGSGKDGRPDGPRALDGITRFIGLRWDDPQTVRLEIRPELINQGGMLSGVATYAMVDYCMGSTLWAHTTELERIATISIAVNYIQTAVEGEIVCRTTLDRRNRTTAVMRSEVTHDDGRVLVTAIGSYSIFPVRKPPSIAGGHPPVQAA
jgi:acyl-coenzyme A thioesterase PaaI-like protein